MGALQKATLQEIQGDANATAVGEPLEVQFNPTTLKLALSNQIEGGDTQGRTTRQVIGANATVLSLELVFDTADEGTDDAPRSVREKTGMVERFVLPRPGSQGENKNQVPPKVRFQWGGLVVEGVVDSVSVDFDHFAADGTPLRAKVGLSIREQDRRYQFLAAGKGANRNGGAPAPGGLGLGAVGGASLGISAGFSAGLSLGVSAQVGFALGGETAVDFAARMGLDPGAWRGLGADLSAGLELEAGAEVGFDLGLSAGLGLGAAAGVAPAAGGSLEAAFGLAPETGNGAPPVAAERQAGFALSAAGGVGAALDAVAATRTEAAADAARAGFDAPGPQAAAPPDARPAPAEAARTPLAVSGPRTPTAQAAAAPAPPPPAPDPRTYGYGAPLRPRRATAADERSSTLGGTATLRRAPSPIDPTPVPTVPPWERLPARERGQAAPAREPAARCSCDCRGGGKR
jgi:contractile injection system tube protein